MKKRVTYIGKGVPVLLSRSQLRRANPIAKPVHVDYYRGAKIEVRPGRSFTPQYRQMHQLPHAFRAKANFEAIIVGSGSNKFYGATIDEATHGAIRFIDSHSIRRANPLAPSVTPPVVDQAIFHPDTLSAPARAALWIGSIAAIVTGGGALLAYLWPLPTERLFYKGIVFDIRRSGGTWTARYAFGNEGFSVNGTTRDDLLAHVHEQIDALLPQAAK